MDMGAYKLYTYAKDDNTPELPAGVTSDPHFYDNYPDGANGIDPLNPIRTSLPVKLWQPSIRS